MQFLLNDPLPKKQSNKAFKKQGDRKQKPDTFQLHDKLRFKFVKQPCSAKDLSLNVCMSFCLNLLQSLLNQACHTHAESRWMFLASCPPLPAETAVILAAVNSSLLLPAAILTFEEGVPWLENRREGMTEGQDRQVTCNAISVFSSGGPPTLAGYKGFTDVIWDFPHQKVQGRQIQRIQVPFMPPISGHFKFFPPNSAKKF